MPHIKIVAVTPDVSVTISGMNFPADQTFVVKMGAYGTLGIGGEVVGTKDAASGRSFTATYAIPASLVGASKIAIRLESPEGYFSYDWFENNTSATATPTTASGTSTAATATPVATKTPPYRGIPTFSITTVQQGASVSILTNNFPAGQTFTVKMGEFGTAGVGGIVVGTTESGAGGSIAATYSIPAELAYRDRIAVRLEGPLGYYSYNWFYNNTYGIAATSTVTPTAATTAASTAVTTATTAATSTTGPTPTIDLTATVGPTSTTAPTATPLPTSTITTAATATPVVNPIAMNMAIPTFSIVSVVKDQSVTITGYNFPAGQTFTVRMGPFGTMGINGRVVTTVDTGDGGTFTATYPIPSEVAGGSKIAIRLESSYYYAYNWFFNN